MARIKEIYFLVNGVNQILCTVRALMYLKFNAKLSELTDTFATMAGTLLQFLIIWFVNLSAFVLMAHCIFGDRIEAWSSYFTAVNQAIGISLGQTDFFSMMEVLTMYPLSTTPLFEDGPVKITNHSLALMAAQPAIAGR